ncbi:hypothetical protein ACHAWC_001795 [Mediolabrus comicus]
MKFPATMTPQTTIILIAAAFAALVQAADAFSIPERPQDRRSLLQQIVTAAAASLPSSSANALLVDNSSPDLPAFKGEISEAKQRFQLAIKDIDDLITNYDAISKTGGDNVRLYLGTQGVKSHMYGIMKVLKSLKDEADDIVDYTEAMNEFEAYLFQAEGAAYQSLFVEHSSAKGTPESLLKTAKGDVMNMRKYMGALATQLHLDS